MANDFLKLTLIDKLAPMHDAIVKEAVKAARTVGRRRKAKMRADARVKTGAMRAGVDFEVRQGPNTIELEVGGREKKTPWVEYGTRATAKYKGTRAYPFVNPNLEGMKQEYAEELIDAADRVRGQA